MSRLGKVPTKVRITNIGNVPAKYFLKPRVLRAVRREIMADFASGLQRTPAGVTANWKTPGLLLSIRLYIRQAAHTVKGWFV